MLAAYAVSTDPDDPLTCLRVGEAPERAGATPPADWVPVRVRAAALNHHDLWSLRGVGLPDDRLPMILGCDAAGTTPDGDDVVVHAVIAPPGFSGDETLDPGRTLLSELYPGTLAETVRAPSRNLVPKPAGLSFEQAACLPTSWLTAYRMLFGQAGVRPGDTVLVQGAGGGVSTALVQLGSAAGLRMWVAARDPARAERALPLGADRVFAAGSRLPERVDAVMETVGAATWSHSVKCLRPGGTLVIAGATSGSAPADAELSRVFFTGLRIQGTTMGTRAELERLLAFVTRCDIEPLVDRIVPLPEVASGFSALATGAAFGKVVVAVS